MAKRPRPRSFQCRFPRSFRPALTPPQSPAALCTERTSVFTCMPGASKERRREFGGEVQPDGEDDDSEGSRARPLASPTMPPLVKAHGT